MTQLKHRFALGEFGDTSRRLPGREHLLQASAAPLRDAAPRAARHAAEGAGGHRREITRLARVHGAQVSHVNGLTSRRCGSRTSRETADHSGPYLIAAALVDGEITEDTFEPDRFQDPALLAVTDTIELIEDLSYTDGLPLADGLSVRG